MGAFDNVFGCNCRTAFMSGKQDQQDMSRACFEETRLVVFVHRWALPHPVAVEARHEELKQKPQGRTPYLPEITVEDLASPSLKWLGR